MSMVLAPPPPPPPPLAAPPIELQVEAGSTAERLLDISGSGSVELYVRGFRESWYTLSERHLELHEGEPSRVLLVVHPPAMEHGAEPGAYDVDVVTRGADGDTLVRRLRICVLAPGNPRSRLLEFLPRHYQADDFLGRFLLIFQAALDRIEHTIDNTHFLLDPGVAPSEFLTWLAGWLDLDLAATSDLATQRLLIERAVELYRWKGTRRGLRAELALRLNARALIVENFDGMRLGHDAALGVNTHLGRRRDGCVTLTLGTPAPPGAEFVARAEDLVQDLKPAGCGYIVRCVPMNGTEPGVK